MGILLDAGDHLLGFTPEQSDWIVGIFFTLVMAGIVYLVKAGSRITREKSREWIRRIEPLAPQEISEEMIAYRPFREQNLQAKDNDHDTDHSKKAATEAESSRGGEANSFYGAFHNAMGQNVVLYPDQQFQIDREGDSYRWRLVPREKKVEPSREDAQPGVDEEGEEDIYDAVRHHRKAHPEPPFVHSDYINKLISSWKASGAMPNAKAISDGYHTFQELYDMRLALTRSTFHAVDRMWHAQWRMTGADQQRPFKTPIWRSRQHSDGTMFDGMFIVGYAQANFLQITFHYHDEHWDKFDFAQTLEKAPEWDGHMDKDVIERLLAL